MKDFVSVKEAAASWNVSERRVHKYCESGRISGAFKYGNCWMIPEGTEKPSDPRKNKLLKNPEPSYLFFVSADIPRNDPSAVFGRTPENLRPLLDADFAFRRGDPNPAKLLWKETPPEDKTKLSAASLAMAAAVSSGDYELYAKIGGYLEKLSAEAKTDSDRYLISIPKALVAVSMALPDLTPDWLKACDFSMFGRELYPFLLYLYTLHLRNTRRYDAMLSAASSTLLLCHRKETFTWLDIYLGVLCAEAAFALNEAELSECYLSEAIRLGIPNGFIAPFADNLGAFGGKIENAVRKIEPDCAEKIVELWNSSFKNWMRFRNLLSKDNITTILNAQEYHTARLIAGGFTYAGAAAQLHLSVSRVKKILSEVYGKLYIHKKKDLSDFII